MDDFLLQMPKAELHLHLEGSVEPETLHELDPATPIDELRALYEYADFEAFLRTFGAIGKRLRTPGDYGLITRRLLERLAEQNVRYAEIIIAAGVVLWKQQEFGPIFDAIVNSAAESPVQTRWIFDAVRQFGVEPARQVAEWAAARQDRGVVALGIGGSEARGPAEWFGRCSPSPGEKACIWWRTRARGRARNRSGPRWSLERSGSATGFRRSRTSR